MIRIYRKTISAYEYLIQSKFRERIKKIMSSSSKISVSISPDNISICSISASLGPISSPQSTGSNNLSLLEIREDVETLINLTNFSKIGENETILMIFSTLNSVYFKALEIFSFPENPEFQVLKEKFQALTRNLSSINCQELQKLEILRKLEIINTILFKEGNSNCLRRKLLIKNNIELSLARLSLDNKGKIVRFAKNLLQKLNNILLRDQEKEKISTALFYGKFRKAAFKELPCSIIIGENGGLFALISVQKKEMTVFTRTKLEINNIFQLLENPNSKVRGNKIKVNGEHEKVLGLNLTFTRGKEPARVVFIRKIKSPISEEAFDTINYKTYSFKANKPHCSDMSLAGKNLGSLNFFIIKDCLYSRSGDHIFTKVKYCTWEYQKEFMKKAISKFKESLENGNSPLRLEHFLFCLENKKLRVMNQKAAKKQACTHYCSYGESNKQEKEEPYQDASHIEQFINDVLKNGTDVCRNEIKKVYDLLNKLKTKNQDLKAEDLSRLLHVIENVDDSSENMIKDYVSLMLKAISKAEVLDCQNEIRDVKNSLPPLKCTNEKFESLADDALKFLELDAREIVRKFWVEKHRGLKLMFLTGQKNTAKNILLQANFFEALKEWDHSKLLPIYLKFEGKIDNIEKNIQQVEELIQQRLDITLLKAKGIKFFIFIEGIFYNKYDTSSLSIDLEKIINFFGLYKENSKILCCCEGNFRLADLKSKLSKKVGIMISKVKLLNIDSKRNFAQLTSDCETFQEKVKILDFLKSKTADAILFIKLMNSSENLPKNRITLFDIYKNYFEKMLKSRIKKFEKLKNQEIINKITNILCKKYLIVGKKQIEKLFIKLSFSIIEAMLSSNFNCFKLNQDSELLKELGFDPSIPLKEQYVYHIISILPIRISFLDKRFQTWGKENFIIEFEHASLAYFLITYKLVKQLTLNKTLLVSILGIYNLSDNSSLINFVAKCIPAGSLNNLPLLIKRNSAVELNTNYQIQTSNAISILIEANFVFRGKKLTNLFLKDVSLENGFFAEVDFSNSTFINVNFANANFNAACFDNCKYQDCQYKQPLLKFPSGVYSLGYNKVRKHLAVGLESGIIIIWDYIYDKKLKEIPTEHHGLIAKLSFSRAGNKLGVLFKEGLLSIFTLNEEKDEEFIVVCENPITSFEFHPIKDNIFLKIDGEVLKIMDISTLRSLKEFILGDINLACFTPDGSSIILTFSRSIVKIVTYDESDYLAKELYSHSSEITVLTLSPNNSYIASGSIDGTVYLWNRLLGVLELKFYAHSDSISCLTFSDNSMIFASCANSSILKKWDLAGNLQESLPNDSSTNCLISTKFSIIVAGKDDGNLHFYERKRGADINLEITCISPSEDYKRFILGTKDSRVFIVDSEKMIIEKILTNHNSEIISVGFASEEYAFTAAKGRRIYIWNCNNWEVFYVHQSHKANIKAVLGLRCCSSLIVSASGDGINLIWNFLTGEQLYSIKLPVNTPIYQIQASSKNKVLLLNDMNGKVYIYNVLGECKEIINKNITNTNTKIICLSPCAKYIAFQSSNNKIVQIKTRSDKYNSEYDCTSLTPKAFLSYSSDSNFLISGSEVGEIIIYKRLNGSIFQKLKEEIATPKTAYFHENTKNLMMICSNKSLFFFKKPGSETIKRLREKEKQINSKKAKEIWIFNKQIFGGQLKTETKLFSW